MGRKYSKVKPEEGKVLEELEARLGKEIKGKKQFKWDDPGYTNEEDSVIALNLNFKDLKDLPESIGELSSLQTLSLHKNQLSSLPNSLGKLKALQMLDLGENNLKSLPDSIGNLISIKEFWINENKLTDLPTSIGKLKLIEDLNLEHNRLETLPELFGDLKSLESLDLSHNQLTSIPESIGKLKSLKILDLEHNKLEWLPQSIGYLRKLEKLDLSHNKLNMLPGFIDNLKSLKTLDIRRNQLVTLPGYLWRLQNLQELRISGNPLVDEWSKIKNKGTEAILDYCREIGSVNVFLSYSVADYESAKYPIDEIANKLKAKEYISYVYHCSQDMKKDGQIDRFMNEIIPHCQFVVFMATKRSTGSSACLHELSVTSTHNIKIIPILFDVDWENPALKRLGLTREFGLSYQNFENNIGKLTNEIYDNILQYKRKHNVFTRQEAERQIELLNIKRTIVNFLESSEFEKTLNKNLEEFKTLFLNLSASKISPRNYFLQCAEILSPSRKDKATKSTKKTTKEPIKKTAKKM